MYKFSGAIEPSKSLFNRALIAKSFLKEFKIIGESQSEDVQKMQAAIIDLESGKTEFDCGAGGTVVRFLALRLSRLTGTFELKGEARLFERPHAEIVFVLEQLGVDCVLHEEGITITGKGWKKPLHPIQVHRDDSSQFASGILLASWDLAFPLEFQFSGTLVSESYFQMTVKFLESLGLRIEKRGDTYFVPPNQKLRQQIYEVEPDYSSMATIGVAAAIYGQAIFESYLDQSLQPDWNFPKLLNRFGAMSAVIENRVLISRPKFLTAANVSLAHNPDLFPALAVLASFCQGTSRLTDAPHLKYKESDRINRTFELLKMAQVTSQKIEGGLEINGRGPDFIPKAFSFDPDQDHRMAMAAGLLKKSQANIEIKHPEVVNKSFPGFWKALGLT